MSISPFHFGGKVKFDPMGPVGYGDLRDGVNVREVAAERPIMQTRQHSSPTFEERQERRYEYCRGGHDAESRDLTDTHEHVHGDR